MAEDMGLGGTGSWLAVRSSDYPQAICYEYHRIDEMTGDRIVGFHTPR